jgi:hypothetical protein
VRQVRLRGKSLAQEDRRGIAGESPHVCVYVPYSLAGWFPARIMPPSLPALFAPCWTRGTTAGIAVAGAASWVLQVVGGMERKWAEQLQQKLATSDETATDPDTGGVGDRGRGRGWGWGWGTRRPHRSRETVSEPSECVNP